MMKYILKILIVKTLVLAFFISFNAFGSQFLLKEIYFKGLKTVDVDSVLSTMLLHPGDVLDNTKVSQAIRSVYRTGKFKDVKILHDRNSLLIQVKENPILTSIHFSGNLSVDKKALTHISKQYELLKEKRISYSRLYHFNSAIKELYCNIGKYNVRVHTEVRSLADNKAHIKIRIHEGKSANIKSINIIGNKNFSNEKLLSFFQRRYVPKLWFNQKNHNTYGVYQRRKLYEELKALTKYYLNHGYSCFSIRSVQIKVSPKKKAVCIFIYIKEGKHYNFSGLKIYGKVKGHIPDIIKLIKFNARNVYSVKEIYKIENNIKDILSSYGYISSNIQHKLKINKGHQKEKLLLNIKKGAKYFVRSINFRGNTKSKNITLQQSIPQKEGSWLNTKLIKEGEQNLKRLGYLKNISVQLRSTPRKKQSVDVFYTVEDTSNGSFNFSIGYGKEHGLNLRMGTAQSNLLGTGYSISLNGIKNQHQTYSEITLDNPYFMSSRVTLHHRIFYDSFQSEGIDLSSYTNKRYGVDELISFPINIFSKIRIGMGYVYNNLRNTQPQEKINQYLHSISSSKKKDESLRKKNFSARDFIFIYGWFYNKTSTLIFPYKGNSFDFQGEVTLPGSKNRFYKLSLDALSYLPLCKNNKWIFLSRIYLGYGSGVKKSRIPFYKNFHTNRLHDIRGFKPHNIGPKATYYSTSRINKCNLGICKSRNAIGGNAVAISNIELIFPSYLFTQYGNSSIRASIFLDSGIIWDSNFNKENLIKNPRVVKYRSSKEVRMSIGIAARWISPVGPLTFSYSLPIISHSHDQIENMQINVGKTW